MKLLLAIDIGTSGCKTTFFNLDGNVVASHTKNYKTFYPARNYAEQSPDDWWNAICTSIKHMIIHDNIDVSNVAGIGVDGISWACIPVDKDHNALRNIMLWYDRRAEKQADYIKSIVEEERLINLCGNPIDATYITPKILWFKENEPDLYAKTDAFLQSNSYIVMRLTDKYSSDYSQGYGFHFFDITNKTYNSDIAKKLGFDLSTLPPLMHSHEIVGGITKESAAATGLLEGTPVVAGGLDAACCTLGAGVLISGQTQEQGGQAGGMSILCENPLIHPKLILGCHVVPDKWLLQGGTVGGGSTLNWFNRELGYFEKIAGKAQNISSFEVMSQEAEGISPGSDGLIYLPYMSGERSPIWDGNARGVYLGLSFDKTRAHMIRSTMEGVGYALQHNLMTSYEADADVNELISVGGSANSAVWTQLKADITGKTIKVPKADEATGLGAAILAGVGTGCYESFEEAVYRTVKIQKEYIPNMKHHEIYSKYYDIYVDLYGRLKTSFDALAAIDE